jgi:hypothetical protein
MSLMRGNSKDEFDKWKLKVLAWGGGRGGGLNSETRTPEVMNWESE